MNSSLIPVTNPSRRSFLRNAAAGGAGLLILPSGTLLGMNKPSNRLNIALIGCWGRGKAHWPMIKDENVVALCDVDERHLALAAAEFPGAKLYKDWRKCLDQKDIDAVICAVPDHHHAHISIWAMNRGYHIYGEKPLANTVEEARMVRETYLKNKHKLATQCGTQRHEKPNFARVRELILDGAIGKLQQVHAWGNRTHDKTGYLPAAGNPPDFLDYDLWTGPSTMHPYNPGYFDNHEAKPGTGCLFWNMYRDFGNWQIGDMGSHVMDLAWNALDADYPLTAEASGDPYNPEVAPSLMSSRWINPANDWRGEIMVSWQQGGPRPASPIEFVDLEKLGHGVLYKGSEGYLVTSFDQRILIPYGKGANMTYYDRRPEDALIPELDGFHQQWIRACKGDLKTSCNYDYAGIMIEQLLLGMIAFDTGEKLEYDAQNMRFTNSEKANQLIRKSYREGWPLNS
ncbi:MAG TPA: Gfo/Idh/MocA family oxidoreductase [Oceanipulchritudo sp.]|nr:Gfo/Idh/MocA family oxidoreductase [Oceanipulchritudo sp.]